VTLALCWAHWRRQFFDLAKSPPAPIATEALKRSGESAEERLAVRQAKTRPLVEALKIEL
jgi:transposase